MCDKAFEEDSFNFEYVPDHFKTQEMCAKAIEKDLWYLRSKY